MATTMEAIVKIAAKGEGFKSVENQIKAVDVAADGLNKSIGGINNIIGGLTGGVVALGAGLTAAGLVAFAKHSIEAGDAMRDLSQKTGISVENLSRFQQVANQSGTDIESVGGGMVKLSKAMKEAAITGSGPAAEAFRTLGISVTDSSGKLRGVDQVMLDVADKFKMMPDGADKAALAVAMFGKKGAELIPMLNEGKQAVAGLAASMSTEFAKNADAYNDKLEAVKTRFGQIGMAVAEQLLPYLTQALDFFGRVGTGLLGMFENNKEAIKKAIDYTLGIAKAIAPWIIGIGAVTTAYKTLGLVMESVAVVGALIEAVTTKGAAMRLLVVGGAAALLGPVVGKALLKFKEGFDDANKGVAQLKNSIKQAADDINQSSEAAKGFQENVNAINNDYNLLKATIEATSSAVQRQSTLKQATFTADIAINNAAKSILQAELQQATTKEQKIRLTTQIMNLDLANAKLQMEAARAQIASEIEIARLKRQSALEQLKSTEAVILEAKARKQPTAELEQQLALQKIAVNGAEAEYKLAQQVGQQRLRADKAQYDANVFQINSTAQMQLDSLNKQDQALNNIVLTSGRLADSSASVASNFENAASAASNLSVSYVGAGGRVSSQPQFTNAFGQRFASGGYVNGPTPALVGEAGPEYIIPANRMQAASSAYMSGARGAAVLQGSGNGAAPQVTIQTGPVMQFNGENYVTVKDLHKATQQVAEGVIGRLRTPSARLALGLR